MKNPPAFYVIFQVPDAETVQASSEFELLFECVLKEFEYLTITLQDVNLEAVQVSLHFSSFFNHPSPSIGTLNSDAFWFEFCVCSSLPFPDPGRPVGSFAGRSRSAKRALLAGIASSRSCTHHHRRNICFTILIIHIFILVVIEW